MKIMDKVKKGIRSWLQIQPVSPYNVQINELVDFELNAIRNRIWYRGDGNELEQMYSQMQESADRFKFWASRCTRGMEMRKIHTGLPGLIVRILTSIVMEDMNDIKIGDAKQADVWAEIEKENKFRQGLEKVIKELLYIGDGAYKVTIDTEISQYPILEWYPGECIEIVHRRGRLHEVIFKTPYDYEMQRYVLHEHYGFGYIRNKLYKGDKLMDYKTFPPLAGLQDVVFGKSVILAVPVKVFESAKWDGRGGSIYDGKLDNFDALDEAWSQWMDALRAGRAKTYIPDSLIPRNPETGEITPPNPFDNRYIATDTNMTEKADNKIDTEQPTIPHESYLSSYCTALDLCLQGVISPSTLGIDVKKLDNAEAQREKEKATLYTRNAIVEALQECLPGVVKAGINAYNILNKRPVTDVNAEVPFGEYANPSFESQVETLSKARPGSPILSIEAQVEEMWGDTQDQAWKEEEVKRLKVEMGIEVVDENSVAGIDGLEGVADGPGTAAGSARV